MKHAAFGLLALVILAPQARSAETATPEGLDFFEKKIRPVLVDNCLSCHGATKQKAGLRLDLRSFAMKGTDIGPVLVPGKPDQSSLIQAIRYTGDYDMPPKGKLPDAVIADFTHWVSIGAPWPADRNATPTTDPTKTHWAFQPVKAYSPPPVQKPQLVQTPVDSFILHQLESKGLSFAPEADRRTLIRRLSMDLTGLPPSQAEVEAFVNDASLDAYEKLVDRLLATPAYAERWARYWLDLSRYSDTKGYVFQEDRNYPYAYTYRDYVIRSFLEDKPYDQFLMEQLAADLLPLGNDKRSLAALGFLTLGRRFLNNTHDIIDDRLDVTFRGLQGLTVTCARCHDHKYDPIPTRDYYSLYGVFASTTEPAEKPLIGEVERTPELIAFERDLGKLEQERDAFIQQTAQTAIQRVRSPETIAAYLLAVADLKAAPRNDAVARLRERMLQPQIFNAWKNLLENKAKTPKDAIFSAWLIAAATPANEFAKVSATLAGQNGLHPRLAKALAAKPLPDRAAVAKVYADVFAQALKEPQSPDNAAIQALFTNGGPFDFSKDPKVIFVRTETDRLRNLQKKVDEFRAKNPAAPPRAMSVADAPNPFNPYIFVRGNPGNRGPNVPRQFLEVLSGPNRKPFTQGSGRLEMAKRIASPENPLTARVLVNRVWLNHFGAGLVTTPSDFGVRSELPSHPELLDYLAHRFMKEGWSLKKLHRWIVNSATYRQSSDFRPELASIDPENRLLGRMNRRRLDFESLRDSLLAVGGTLDQRIYGRSENLFEAPFSKRRTVYGFIDRQNLPGVYRAFDFAGPDTHSPQRFQTTVPQQALFLLNSPLIHEQARAVLQRREIAQRTIPSTKLDAIYQLLFNRRPTADERRMALEFVQSPVDDGKSNRPWQLGYGRFNERTKRIEGFTHFPHFTGTAWQASDKLPDPKFGWLTLNANGGHPDGTALLIRRWIVPADGTYRVQGTLNHTAKQGNGVRGRVITNRTGVVAEFIAEQKAVPTPVAEVVLKAGEPLDFVVDHRGDTNSDGFQWAPTIERITPATPKIVADARRDFPAPAPTPLSAWELLVQALLLSNEFAFAD
ncbi:PSD1 and planctomycete cytochrome C domain-containing protein [Tuwongella immobilis]|uniref:Cytochrome c domain-containing protein n=1 Tax=Tuwongella immobilis TaxID=692036 RepID=A0A6C2YHH7_9BACT|nr:PSD1 and planctomycete cytochrome C domain-containing protein [Tuwongella immobilis]VIP00701.1 signal peptide protein : Uncharacterized protein OS=Singulisphaera acidiphila (strain ATCC BAA-1392 / DSM 18658 / VKM B-2454 / MOB10) GN=Sinac_1739 PE=4 SV=1: PSCyt1: PSCyt2: PSD1 [Tuwongella immobilis]VTR96820.1 signal peptide protein : Uncharacterized protein OS=Singulisphaera acidiphila (strain ATCC BAA-1392 / DSM 18658 / VKM B-2454 / MOB10) GN=Sinac_1739 PE=4 SV=1: PSCyt1: PSCyt2: PSD1 [Tuwongell